MLNQMKNYNDNETQSSRLLDEMATADDNQPASSSMHMLQSIDDVVEEKQDEQEQHDIAGDEEQANIQEPGNDNLTESVFIRKKPLPLITKYIYLFIGLAVFLVLEGIIYAIAYSHNDGDFEFPEVHPFFIFTIFLFFGVLHSIFCKYTWIKN